jgi:tripeptide aminopeptidase
VRVSDHPAGLLVVGFPLVEAADQRLLDRFVRLCEIPSPTGKERAVADAVLAELGELGVEASEDSSAGAARAGAGNLVARIPGRGEGWLSFFCHLDTVPDEGGVEVVEENGVYRSRGETILGADNKAAVTVLVELAARHAKTPPPVGLELIFTVAEEDGLRGAKELDVSELRSPYGFAIDHATPIGEVIIAGPTYKRLRAGFTGQEAHSGINPEEGHSAIAAAAAAIVGMRLGRLDEETTANIGVIDGGTASNVVAGHCNLLGEARSIDGERAASVVGEMVDACTWAAGEHDCDVDVQVSEMFRGYRIDPSAEPVRLASEALRRRGHEPSLVATGGGSDANALLASGFECVLLANGTEANHTPEERVSGAAIVEMLGMCEAIAAEAARSKAAMSRGPG